MNKMYEAKSCGADTIMPILMRELNAHMQSGRKTDLMEVYVLLHDVQALFISIAQDDHDFYRERQSTLEGMLKKYNMLWILNVPAMEQYRDSRLIQMGFEKLPEGMWILKEMQDAEYDTYDATQIKAFLTEYDCTKLIERIDVEDMTDA